MAPAVCDHGHVYSVPGNPASEETRHHGRSSDVVQLGGFQPPGVPVDHGRQVAEHLRERQGPYDVEIRLGEPSGGHWDLPELGDGVLS